MEHLQKTGPARSRIGQANGAVIRPLAKEAKKASLYRKWSALLWIGVATLGYLAIGRIVQHADPASGWLDTGILSLPLFAAWSCLVGYGVAGLLPVLLNRIGRKGGIVKWRSTLQEPGMLIAYIGYIALLCALL